jgi:hypothetical protein
MKGLVATPVVNLIVRIVGYYTLQFCDYFMCGPIGRREIFLTSSLLVEIEGHFTHEFVSYVYETEDSNEYGNTASGHSKYTTR